MVFYQYKLASANCTTQNCKYFCNSGKLPTVLFSSSKETHVSLEHASNYFMYTDMYIYTSIYLYIQMHVNIYAYMWKLGTCIINTIHTYEDTYIYKMCVYGVCFIIGIKSLFAMHFLFSFCFSGWRFLSPRAGICYRII